MKTIHQTILILLLALAPPCALEAQTTETYTFTTNRLVPDGNLAGLSDVRTLGSAIANITSVTVHVNTAGQFNGDLYGYLVHSNGFVVLLNRPGKTASNPYGYADSGFNVIFQDGATNGDIHLYETNTVPASGSPLTGTWQPDGRNVDPAIVLDTSPRTTGLTNFIGLNAAGAWTLFLADMQSGGTNALTQWSLTIMGSATPTLTWTNPASLVYGAALGTSQLNATATYNATNVGGTFTYTNAAGMVLSNGTVLSAGSNQLLYVTFTPTNTASFLPVTASVAINVSAAPVTVASGLTANNKVYDGTTVAVMDSNNVTLAGVLSGDAANVTLSTNGYVAAFTNQNAGTGIGVNVSGLTLTGSAAGNYALTPPTLAANIAAKPLTLTGLSVPASKIYDGTTTAAASGTATLLTAEAAAFGTGGDGKPYTGDTVTLIGTAAGSYNSLTVTGANLVTINGVSTANGNYSLTPLTQAATITAKPLTVSGITTGSAIYDGTTTAKLGGTAAFLTAEAAGSGSGIDGKPYTVDAVSASGTAAGTLAAKSVGSEAVTIGGVTVTGSGSGNYSVTQPTGLTQNVTAKALTMSGLSVPSSKIYNGTTAAVVSGTPILQTAETLGTGTTSDGKPYTGDAVSITGTAMGTYNSSNVLAASSVSFGGLNLAGSQANDYSLTAQSAAAATIAQAGTMGAVVSSANPALPGTVVTFTATISPVGPGAGIPTGAVNFRINGSLGGSGALTNAVGAFASNSLPHGSNTVVAEYAGDGNFVGVTNALAVAEVINTPPVVGNLTIYRYATEGTKVSLSDILTNCSDADGDTLTLTVSATSTNGDAVTVSNGWVYYTPNSGFTNADAFTYTVSDGYGGSAVGTVTVAIEVDNSVGQNLIITSLGNGSYLISGNGVPGYSYNLQYTATLSPVNWQNVPSANITAGTNGYFLYTNTPSGGVMGFYRTVYP
jgi:subtilisin-like proprotein convertase family protein